MCNFAILPFMIFNMPTTYNSVVMIDCMGATNLGTPFAYLLYHLINTHRLLMFTIIAIIEGTLSIWKVNHLNIIKTSVNYASIHVPTFQNTPKLEQEKTFLYNISVWCVQHLRKDSFLKVSIIRHLFCILDLLIMVFLNLVHHQIHQSVMRLCT